MMKNISGNGFKYEAKIYVMIDRFEEICNEFVVFGKVRELWKNKCSKKNEMEGCDRRCTW